MLFCLSLSGLPNLLPVPRYGTFRNEKFFRILGGENAKTERITNLTQVHQISNFKDSRCTLSTDSGRLPPPVMASG